MPASLLRTPVDVLQHPSKEEARIFFYDKQVRAAADVGDKPIVDYVGSDDQEDRYGSVIDPKGWELDSYLRNPVILWAHNYSVLPVGRSLKVTKSKSSLDFRVEFAVFNAFAREVYEMVRLGFLPGVSVGFIPKAAEEFEAQTVSGYFAENKRYVRQELLELSIVPVPANRTALKKAYEDGKLSESFIEEAGLQRFLIGGPIILSRAAAGQVMPTVTPVTVDDAVENATGGGHVEAEDGSPCSDDCPAPAPHGKECGSDCPADPPHHTSMMQIEEESAPTKDDVLRQLNEYLKGTDKAEKRDVADALQAIIDEAQAALDELNGDGDAPDDPDDEEDRGVADALAAAAAGIEQRKGAKLSKKNKEKIKEALKLLQELDGLIEEIEEEEEADENDESKEAKDGENADDKDGEEAETPAADTDQPATELVGGTSGTKSASGAKIDATDEVVAFLRRELNLSDENGGSVNGSDPAAHTANDEQRSTGSEAESSHRTSYLDILIGRKA